MKKEVKTEKKKFVKTKTKSNNTVEVEIQKSPAQTVIGKIFIALVILGMIGLPLVLLIVLIIQNM